MFNNITNISPTPSSICYANQKHPGCWKKCKANQKQQSKWLDVATRFETKLRPKNLVRSCINSCFKILVC